MRTGKRRLAFMLISGMWLLAAIADLASRDLTSTDYCSSAHGMGAAVPGPLNEHGSPAYGVFAPGHRTGTRALTPAPSHPGADPRPGPCRWTRAQSTQARHDFPNPDRDPCSQRPFAHQPGVPRSTLG